MARRATSPRATQETIDENAAETPTDPANNEGAAGAKPRQKRAGGRKPGRPTGRGTSETARLIDALLRSRGLHGADQSQLEQVVRWAEGIRQETVAIEADSAELRKLGPRGQQRAAGGRGSAAAQQRQKQKDEQRRQIEERRLRNSLDQALLAGVLQGDITLDVSDNNAGLLFRHKDANPAAGGVAVAAESAA